MPGAPSIPTQACVALSGGDGFVGTTGAERYTYCQRAACQHSTGETGLRAGAIRREHGVSICRFRNAARIGGRSDYVPRNEAGCRVYAGTARSADLGTRRAPGVGVMMCFVTRQDAACTRRRCVALTWREQRGEQMAELFCTEPFGK
jgi:hypothetical protein